MKRTVAIGMVSLIAALMAVMASTVSGASADCSQRIKITGPAGGKLVLTPDSVKVQVGDCVDFTNGTSLSKPIVVAVNGPGKGYEASVSQSQTVSGAHGFAPTKAGSDAITATGKVLLGTIPVTGTGTIAATSAPKSHPSSSPTPTHKKSSTAKPTKKAHPKKSTSKSPKPHATGIKLPPLPPLPSSGVSTVPNPKGSNPLIAPGPTSATPTVSDSSTPVAAVFGGPIEPAEDNGRGLPIAVGVLIVLGLATGWGRVLLATSGPVDNANDGKHRA